MCLLFHEDKRRFHKVTRREVMEFDAVSKEIIGCAIEVHRQLGPGLLESAYEECLMYELSKKALNVKRQMPIPVIYKDIRLDCGYRIDLLVENSVVIELKSIDTLAPIHHAQILTYMRFSGIKTGLLINFNVTILKNGLKRFVL